MPEKVVTLTTDVEAVLDHVEVSDVGGGRRVVMWVEAQ
jgi:hypothetical protein